MRPLAHGPPGTAGGGAPPEATETEGRPVRSRDYAVLSAAYGGLLGTLVLAARQRGREQLDPLTGPELIPLSLATFALSKLVVHEKVEAWVREPFVARDRATGRRRPRGSGLRYATGELLTCTRCVGTWSALGLVALRLGSPPAGKAVSSVLAVSAANDFLQAGFSLLRERANLT